jgi:acyl dehydratase
VRRTKDHDPREFQVVVGTYEEAVAMIGYEAPPRTGDLAVSEALIQLFCTSTEDGNPSYWDPDFAVSRWGGLVAPPALLMAWVSFLCWKPGKLAKNAPLVATVPLPGTQLINSKASSRIFRPVFVGDRLTAHECLHAVSTEKETHVGRGHFITTKSKIIQQNGTPVADVTNIAFRFSIRDK